MAIFPISRYDPDGDQIEVHLAPDSYYGEQLDRRVGHLRRAANGERCRQPLVQLSAALTAAAVTRATLCRSASTRFSLASSAAMLGWTRR